MSTSTLAKSLKLPYWKGGKDTFHMFWVKFLAYAAVHKFVDALGTSAETDLPATQAANLDPTDANDALSIAARQQNADAILALTSAITCPIVMGYIFDSMSNDWPSGLAWKVVKALMQKHKPDDTLSVVDLTMDLMKIRMKRTDDPENLFKQIACVKNKYTTPSRQVPLKSLLATAIHASPYEYKTVITAEQCRVGPGVVLSDLQSVMDDHYRTLGYSQNRENKKEMTLVSMDDEDDDFCIDCNAMSWNCWQERSWS